MPHRAFWAELPGLVWEGGRFTLHTLRGRGRPSAEESTPFAAAGFGVPESKAAHGRRGSAEQLQQQL